LDEAIEFLNRHFIIVNPSEEQRNLRGILDIAKSLVLRRGIKGLVIDPWNELEQPTDIGMTETQFVTQALIQFRHFCRIHRVHGWMVVHPTKQRKGENGKFAVPTLYDAAGSAAWYNKCDVGIVLHREMSSDVLEVHIQKCRKKWCGRTGVAYLRFDRNTGRYEEHYDERSDPEPKRSKSERYWDREEE
jgi:twinkle protein